MKNINLKNIAHAVKEWAIRFFSVYFFIYALLIGILVISGEKYLFEAITLFGVLVLSTFLKTMLDKRATYINIGFKYGVSLIIFLITYFILCLMTGKVYSAIIFCLSVLSLFGIKETCLFLVECINRFLIDKANKKTEIKLGKPYLSKMFSLDKIWNKEEFDNDEVSKMLYEFINISNDNQMGHVVIRSMTKTDENNVEKLYVKAKDGYHIIVRGKLEHISRMCSEVISDSKLLPINDETIKTFEEKLNNSNCSDNVFCAFKEVKDIQEEENNNYILAGCGIYECEVIEAPVKKEYIKILPAKSYKILDNVFLLLIATIILTANIFVSLFDAFVFNSCEIITAGILCSVFAVITSYLGDLPSVKIKSKCTVFAFSVICVCLVYFIGRYIMTNADCENDLFYIVTANVMTTASLVSYVMLMLLTTTVFNNWISRVISTISCFILLCYMFIPACCKLMQGYTISYIYTSIAYLISIIGVFISSILYFILRKKEDGTEISD